jgi:tetratricopeptide (TPR) repeat protein
MDLKWLLGWMGVAAVIGCLILFLVWAGVQSFQRFESTAVAGAVQKQMDEADQAFKARDFAKALDGYLAAARVARGPAQRVARKNAGVAAYELSLKALEANQADQAEVYARQALDLDQTNLLGKVALGRAMARGGRVEEALAVLDEAHAAAVANKDSANATAAILWKADTLYNDGVANIERDAPLARRRFEAVLQVAPNTMYSRNAQTFLARLNYGPGGGTELQGALPESQIPGFDPTFRNPFGGQAPSGAPGGLSGAGGLPGGFEALLKGLKEGLQEP